MTRKKQAKPGKSHATMIRYRSYEQLSPAEFDWSFQTALNEDIQHPPVKPVETQMLNAATKT